MDWNVCAEFAERKIVIHHCFEITGHLNVCVLIRLGALAFYMEPVMIYRTRNGEIQAKTGILGS
jgi:hypothetical protein